MPSAIGTRNINSAVLEQLFGTTETHVAPVVGARSADVCLQHEAATAFLALQTAAAAAGHDLQIASAFRSFQRQADIWRRKFAASSQDRAGIATILHWSALPGTSRHHWGTDMDIFDATALGDQKLHLVAKEYSEGGPCWPLWRWLQEHAAGYGFYWPYHGRGNGVAAEPWHLSYAPLAEQYVALWRETSTVSAWAELLAAQKLPGLDLLEADFEGIIRRYTLQVEPVSREVNR